MSYSVEAVLLTGGASRRMGMDKAKLLVEGEELASRIARLLAAKGIHVTVCGREPIDGHAFLRDAEEFQGPLFALSGFVPSGDLVFVSSCDLPGFDPALVDLLIERIARHDAAIPSLNERLQPLCGLYRAQAISVVRELSEGGEQRVMRWIDRLDFVTVEDIDPCWITNANSPEDLKGSGAGDDAGAPS